MVKTFTTNTFANVYSDDYDEDKSFQRILFNNKKALQARELTQLQTIIQEGINRFGKNIFKEGAAVSAGGVAINNSCLLYTSPSPRDRTRSRMPSSA